jgi:hypothetical protein
LPPLFAMRSSDTPIPRLRGPVDEASRRYRLIIF